jgi:hypothetical protein
MSNFSEVTLKPVKSAFGGENDERTIVEGYMCMVDFYCELGCASDGNEIYPCEETLRRNRKCVNQCGIVKVAVVAIEIVQEEKFDF